MEQWPKQKTLCKALYENAFYVHEIAKQANAFYVHEIAKYYIMPESVEHKKDEKLITNVHEINLFSARLNNLPPQKKKIKKGQ